MSGLMLGGSRVWAGVSLLVVGLAAYLAWGSVVSGDVVFAVMNIFLGGVIAGFLIFEPRGLMHRWNIIKRSYRTWPYPY